MEKTTVFNLIILDESGSMSSAVNATISGCNETVGVARDLQKKHADRQRSLMSIYAFQSGSVPSRYLVKNEPVEKVRDITNRDYQPCGCTPLLDAVGMTLADLKAVADTHEDALGIVTIITDGYENSSTEYTYQQISSMIDELKAKGWIFNFIGANIDVAEVASKMNIDNTLSWRSDEKGTTDMYDDFMSCIKRETDDRIAEEQNMSKYERVKRRRRSSNKFFDR